MAQQTCLCGEPATQTFVYADSGDTYAQVPLCDEHLRLPPSAIIHFVQLGPEKARHLINEVAPPGFNSTVVAFGMLMGEALRWDLTHGKDQDDATGEPRT